MNISAPFIDRPVATTLLTIAVALSGVVSYRLLPVSALPQVDFPTISVSASLPGASPETMASSVATPLERQFGRIAGLTEMTSTSYLGTSQVVLQFDLSRNIDGAARDVQAAINAARADLPANLPSNPTYRKVNPADAPILMLSLTSDALPIASVFDAASSILQQKLSQVDGVGQVTVGGGALPAVRVELNPEALSRYGIGLDQVRSILNTTNATRPTGQVSDDLRSWTIRTTDELSHAAEFAPIVIAWRNGAPVRLSDVASVEDSVQDLRTLGLTNGHRAVTVMAFREPGANIIETVDRIKELLPELRASIPAAINVQVASDRTTTIRASVRDVERTLVLAIVLVILVVFAFLRSPRVTFIPGVAVPLSLLGTFDIMALLGYSLDTLSLMALTISTGFVIDDAIVVVENVSRHLERGASPREAARAGSQEIAFTVLSMSTSLVAVFIPILLMQGIVGRLFREFAVTLAAAIGVSMVVSLTTTPMLCAQVLRRDDGRRHGWLYRLSERAFDRSLDLYDALLGPVLRHPVIMLVVVAITMAVTVHLYTVIPKGFFPQEDTGTLTGNVQARQDISFQAMHDKLTRIATIVTNDPAIASVVAFTGGGGSTTNTARLFVILKPLEERGASPNEIIGRLVRRTALQVEGARLFLQMSQDIRVGGRGGNAQYQYTLQADNVADLATWAPRVTSALTGLPELSQVNSDQQNRSLQSSIDVNRDTATRLGLSMRTIDASLGSAFGQSEVSTIYTPLNQYHVVMEAAPVWWQSPDTLQRFYVRSAANAEVPLAAFSSYRPSLGTLAVTHHGQFPSATISFNLASGKSLGEAVDAVNTAMQSIGLPPSMRASFQGTAQAFQSSLRNQPLLVLAAIAVVYIVLGVLYESMVHPITILSTLPSAGMGALLALMWFRLDLSVMAIIGILLLVGIVKKNAIMMIDVALETNRRGETSPEDAIKRACLVRFRPIMMTTMAAMLGALPVALASGIGSELRRPLGVAIVGGLLVSQILTLFTTPIIYLMLERLREATIGRV